MNTKIYDGYDKLGKNLQIYLHSMKKSVSGDLTIGFIFGAKEVIAAVEKGGINVNSLFIQGVIWKF